MCTAISFHAHSHYFGRNLDLEFCFDEAVTITPRAFPFVFRTGTQMPKHYAMIGVATVSQNYPLYYDATNETGLSVAGLNFPGNAVYRPRQKKTNSISPFELIPWVLSQCKDTAEAVALLSQTSLNDIPFSDQYPLTDLHWLIADRTGSFTVEPGQNGLEITENPFHVLTNNPPFSFHTENIKNYLQLSDTDPVNHFAPFLPLTPYSRGMGAMGMPGDLSSASRFIRGVFTNLHSVKPDTEEASVNQFFHVLGSVAQQEGCVKVGDKYEKTVYSSCCNTQEGIYYYTTYENRQVTGIRMHRENLEGKDLISYPLDRQYHFSYGN